MGSSWIARAARRAAWAAAAGLTLTAAMGPEPAQAPADPVALRCRGWSALRAMNCERCHGRDLDGWSAPDLIASVRDGSRERFERIVLDGVADRGMPGYRGQALVAAEIDGIYAYLQARAERALPAGRLDCGAGR